MNFKKEETQKLLEKLNVKVVGEDKVNVFCLKYCIWETFRSVKGPAWEYLQAAKVLLKELVLNKALLPQNFKSYCIIQVVRRTLAAC